MSRVPIAPTSEMRVTSITPAVAARYFETACVADIDGVDIDSMGIGVATNTARPASDAHVRAQVRMASAPQSGGRSSEHRAMSDAQILTPAVRRLDAPGMFAFSHQMDAPGAYEIAVIVDAIGDKPLDPPVTVFAVRAVPMNRTSHSTGFRATPTLLVSGAVMLAMMLLMTRRF